LLVSEGEETKMGIDAYQGILKKSKVSSDPRLNEQVTRVGQRIAAATARNDYQWEFKVLEDTQANAFCLPGGKVAVYTGILPLTRNDAGLATVLGHEVAHATAEHSAERIERQKLTKVAAAIIAGGVAFTPAQYVRVVALLGVGGAAASLPFSRAQESEADHIGLLLMAQAGYDPHGALAFWQRMERAGGQNPPEFLSTHPSHGTREQQIQAWLPEALRYFEAAGRAPDEPLPAIPAR